MLRSTAAALTLCAAAGRVSNLTQIEPPTLDGMLETLRNFEQAAIENEGSRSIAKGYNKSAEYVLSELSQFTDELDIHQQYFTVPVFSELEKPTLTFIGSELPLSRCETRTGWQHYESGCDYSGVRYGGNTNGLPLAINAQVQQVFSPCHAAGFSGFPAGRIAVLTVNSECDYFVMVTNAQNAGAAGVLLANPDGTAGIPGGRVFDSATWNPSVSLPHIPTIGITATVKTLLLERPDPVVRMELKTTIKIEHTFNIIVNSRFGDLDSVLMIGSHLDSVPEGPGINDNGSGSSVVLEMAKQYARSKRRNAKKNKNESGVRFAWWGAEEIGLMGSRYYVDDLVEHYPHDLAKIKGYLNFDMEAGPNYIRMVYDGTTAPEPAREGSIILQNQFIDAWGHMSLSYAMTAMYGGSDFLPFILAGVASSGLATGAGGLKSDSERTAHGGLANTPLDPCYHAPCDTVANVNHQCLEECATALYHVFMGILENPLPSRPVISHEDLKATYKKNILRSKKGFAMSCDAHDEDTGEDEL
eukprot:TRINITY_DN5253_c0_g2_i1.p1 TRINITY_DN5253_c0_g2~~TRINITY_DN5253_c0_g2_i1.p1  ORF type:complete len:545 (+),score=99.89 TRINITY_DN5253_c0_g2_i1:51-1637(+)